MALTNPTAQKSGNAAWLLEFSKAKGGAHRPGFRFLWKYQSGRP